MSPRPGRAAGGRFARLVVAFRHVILLAWVAGAAACVLTLPSLEEARGEALGSLVPRNAPAFRTQIRSAELFRIPILSNTLVVQRDPEGLSPSEQARVVERAVKIARRDYPDLLSVPFALPLLNTAGAVPGSREVSTTAVTYLYFEPDLGLQARDRLAHWFTDRRFGPEDALVGVTGVVPARVEQGRLIEEALPLIEVATVVLIALVIGLTYRALVAPLLTLLAVGISFVVAVGALAALGELLGIAVPSELEPIVLVLLLGIVTDYSIFFLSGLRHRLQEGESRLVAARATTAEFTPIILAAGLIVAAGTASLLVAQLEFFRIFGPALALTVIVGLAVSLTFIPAALAVLGSLVFWPARAVPDPLERRRPRKRTPLVAQLARHRFLAALFALLVVAGLVVAAGGLRDADLGVKPIRSLPDDSEPARAAEAASTGFVPGVLSPTLLVLEQRGLNGFREELARFQRRLRIEHGVAAVLGPANLPAEVPPGVALSETGSAARFVILLEEEPLSSAALEDLDRLRESVPELARRAGLLPSRVDFAGNTALADETIEVILEDLVRIAIAALVVNVLFLVVFLRALVAPLYLLATSVLALAAALGVTALLFVELLGRGQLTYYVPFMAAVLVVSLGSDYNVFLVGRIWHEARRRPLREAVAEVAPRASRAINVAGLALALSFALLALVPLSSFREFAVAMVAGVLVEAFLVRTYLVPALLSLFGNASRWPGGRGR
ncbi:MAG TPA: MMPL family transporter [Gaiellaceae bacterium]|nr:MMPL family transporter [Gaiellaceae bacterium]